jgi:hypothetical protein
MTEKEITPEQKEKLKKFFRTPFEKSNMHKVLMYVIGLILLFLIVSTFVSIWGPVVFGVKLGLTALTLFCLSCLAHSLLEAGYKRLWHQYVKEYPFVYKEIEDEDAQRIKDNHKKQLSRFQKRLNEGLEELNSLPNKEK